MEKTFLFEEFKFSEFTIKSKECDLEMSVLLVENTFHQNMKELNTNDTIFESFIDHVL